jgi:hypothetical protein
VDDEVDPQTSTTYDPGIQIGNRKLGAPPPTRHDWAWGLEYTLRPRHLRALPFQRALKRLDGRRVALQSPVLSLVKAAVAMLVEPDQTDVVL